LDSAEQIAAVRNRFETISLQWSERERLLSAKHDQDQKTAVRSALAAEEARATSLRDAQAAEHARAIAAQEAKLAEQQKKIDADARKIAADAGRIAADAEKIAADAKQAEAQSQRITALGDEVGKLRRDLEATRNSRSWRITKPLRMAATLLRSKRPR
jgi:membrane protein involved in colicin uptake